jgi:hypothetical protein
MIGLRIFKKLWPICKRWARSVFYVSQKEPTDDIWFNAGSALSRWKVDKSDIIEIP